MKPILTTAALLLASTALAEPWPTPAPNAANQTPAFAEQTRAPAMNSGVTLTAQPIVRGLNHPWALALTPDGGALVMERAGNLRLYQNGTLSEPVRGIPEVAASGQGGLLDVALSPDFAQSRVIFLSYAEPREGGNGTSVARMRLADDGASVSDVQVIFRQTPTYQGNLHFGGRIVPAPDGSLFITLGERSNTPIRDTAQDLGNTLGKLVRILPDGSIPADNPFVTTQGARPEIYALGFRNVQAAALDPQGRLWTVEHGPRGGDEVNRPEPGKNYGWPVITYGQAYSGAPINQGITAADGMEQPVYYWDPVIAPSGAAFYDGAALPDWRGNLLIGAMNPAGLVRLKIDGNRVTGEERFDPGIGRIRDVQIAPDGSIWVVTDEANGGLYRLTPAG
ncbi:MAG: PQQ-dependent sugar dehydrogenase [Paracoccus sp. (in: a-proteobacteria)]|uniref:PQQ-dependent sugar dehydrogenase n=1 Tax=Paracoccus sp. TaxID=267 RepID=UPI0026DEADC4|nr:PQQ-dependent sugar dehydrogenase [Paracoccus sp. (in: a-proteobacteria)]MDO5622461.1 PQQ-dependent sugar dehydrogenase [Paracoccus sp. (in: a-proteobacteria)]